MGPDDADEEPVPDGDDAPLGDRPDPSDRAWFHPTELSSFVATPTNGPAPPRPREWMIGLLSAIAGIAVTVLVLVAFGAIGGRHRTTLLPPVVSDAAPPFDANRVAEIANQVAPSIVTVKASIGDTTVFASGVAFSSTDVLTSAHVVSGATAVVITTHDGRTITAKIVGSDPTTDLALLDVANGNLSFAALSSSDGPDLAQAVVGIGAEHSGPPWVGFNVVDKRNVLVPMADTTLVGLLQTGMNPPPEASGGALFDQNGHVVGLLTTPPGVAVTGLAVPIGMARDVQDQLDSSGKVTHGWLGVLATQDPPDTSGVVITAIAPNSPAEKAGLHTGDVVVRAGGQSVNSGADLWAQWVRHRPGDTLEIDYVRDGRTHATTATLNSGPFATAAP
jgi:S1-C subfamily serine protease